MVPLPEAHGDFGEVLRRLGTTAADFGSRWSSDAGFVGDKKVDAGDLWTAPTVYAESQPPSFVLKMPLAGNCPSRSSALTVASVAVGRWRSGEIARPQFLGSYFSLLPSLLSQPRSARA